MSAVDHALAVAISEEELASILLGLYANCEGRRLCCDRKRHHLLTQLADGDPELREELATLVYETLGCEPSNTGDGHGYYFDRLVAWLSER